MASLYPTLEDMTVDEVARAQISATLVAQAAQQANAATGGMIQASTPSLYAGLGLEDLAGGSYLGMDLTPEGVSKEMGVPIEEVRALIPAYQAQSQSQAIATLPGANAVASITPKGDKGMLAAQIQQGVQRVNVSRDAGTGKLGLGVKAIDNGVFVSFVWSGSPAARAGIKFGDQILSINDHVVAGLNDSKALKLLTEKPDVTLIIRDRPLCRTVTVIKDHNNQIGFVVHHGEITHLVKDSSAARNGVLIHHHLLEVNGQNVVGMADHDVVILIQAAPQSVTLTVVPNFMYKTLIKKIGNSTMKKHMDHTVPDI